MARLSSERFFRQQFGSIFSPAHPLSDEEAADQWSSDHPDGGHRLGHKLISLHGRARELRRRAGTGDPRLAAPAVAWPGAWSTRWPPRRCSTACARCGPGAGPPVRRARPLPPDRGSGDAWRGPCRRSPARLVGPAFGPRRYNAALRPGRRLSKERRRGLVFACCRGFSPRSRGRGSSSRDPDHPRGPREAQGGDRAPPTVKRREVADRIKEAREFGDISENAEYDDAKNEQALLEQRIAQLEERLRRADRDRREAGRTPTRSRSARSSTSRTRSPASPASSRSSARPRPNPTEAEALERVADRQGADRAQDATTSSPSRRRAARRRSSRSRRSKPLSGPSPAVGSALVSDETRSQSSERDEPATSSPSAARSSPACARPGSSPSRTRSATGPRSPRCAARTRGSRPAWRPKPLPGRGPAHRPARPGQGGVPRPRDGTGQIQLQARESTTSARTLRAPPPPRPRRHRRRRGHRVRQQARRALASAPSVAAAREEPAPAARQVPRPRGRRDPLPPSRARPDRERGGPRAVRQAGADDRRDPALARRARLHRGRDADPPAALRRRAGAAVHDPPQRARPRPLPADRDRALPEALHRRRHRPRLRARQGLPQRGRLAQAQPRVHDARVVRGLRGLRGRRERLEQLVAEVAEDVLGTTVVERDGAKIDLAPPWRRVTLREAIRERDRHRRRRAPDPRGAGRGDGVEPDPEEGWGKLVDGLLSKAVEPKLDPADLRHRLPGRAVAVRQGATAARRGWSSAGRRSSAGWRSPTPSPSSTTPTSSAAASSSRREEIGRGDEEAQPFDENYVAGARAGHAADRRRRPRDRPAGDDPDRRDEPARGRAVPGDAQLAAAPFAGRPAHRGRSRSRAGAARPHRGPALRADRERRAAIGGHRGRPPRAVELSALRESRTGDERDQRQRCVRPGHETRTPTGGRAVGAPDVAVQPISDRAMRPGARRVTVVDRSRPGRRARPRPAPRRGPRDGDVARQALSSRPRWTSGASASGPARRAARCRPRAGAERSETRHAGSYRRSQFAGSSCQARFTPGGP